MIKVEDRLTIAKLLKPCTLVQPALKTRFALVCCKSFCFWPLMALYKCHYY